MDEKLISQQLKHICDKLDRMDTKNETDHGKIFASIEGIKVSAAEDRGHTHPHCEDCLVHGEAISTLKKWVYAIGGVSIIASLRAFWSNLMR